MTLIFLIAFSLFTFLTVDAQAATRAKTTYAFINAIPNPAPVDQTVLFHVGITDYLENVNEGWTGITVTVTKPDGTNQTLGPFRTDSTGGVGVSYIPDQVGNYTLQTHFPAQNYTWRSPPIFDPEFTGTILYRASNSQPVRLVVQQDPLPAYPGIPLPTEYWSRPIDAQAREWAAISGNWPYAPLNLFAANNLGPETPHVLWAKPLIGAAGSALGGGLVGGVFNDTSFENGDAYEGFFLASSALGSRWSVIIGGVVYTNYYKTDGSTRVEQDVIAVDLRTGEELWRRNWNNTRLEFGQIFYWDSFNYHAAFAYLWSVTGSTYNAYEAQSGRWAFSINNVPSGTRIFGPNGEIIIYTINQANGWLTKWNSTRVITETRRAVVGSDNQAMGSWVREYMGTTLNGTNGMQWNRTIPRGLPGALWQIIEGDILLGNDALGWEAIGDDPVALWAINLKPGQEGTILYNTTFAKPSGDIAMRLGTVSPADRIFTLFDKENRQNYGFNLDNGQLIWGPSASMDYRGIYGMTHLIAYGKLFVTADFGGQVMAFDAKTGQSLWTYTARDPYSSDIWIKEVGGNEWAMQPAFIADGKLYLGQSEHSPYNPLPRDAPFIALDVNTGAEVFRANGLFRQTRWGGRAIIGDSIIATMDTYDQRLYAVGRGPSAVTVSLANDEVANGAGAIFRGTVMDISAGTTDERVAARFPNGVPAVSDASMTEWMRYVYKQFPRPTNITGVEISLSAIDPNGNMVTLGNATTDANGRFTLRWVPPASVTGPYSVIASFAGSKSYWPSSTQTVFYLAEASPTTTQTAGTDTQSLAELYFIPAVVGLFIAIILVGLLLALMIRRRT